MDHALIIGIDLLAICVLTFGLYFPRHRRRDLIVAFLGVNIGVLAVAGVLASSAVGIGLGLGLFAVLSIIRLRSYELEQNEIAYYFAALALGVVAGLSPTADPLTIALMALIVAVVFVGDHPSLFQRYRQQIVVLDSAFTDESRLVDHLEVLLGARVYSARIRQLDLVNDSTVVDVRFRLPSPRASARADAHAVQARG